MRLCRRALEAALLISMVTAAALWPVGRADAATLPSGFTDEVVTAVPSPTSMAFTPDGRMLITSQPGQLRVFQGGSLVPTAALDLAGRICNNSERGLLGVAVDPSFATPGENWIYVYYTFRKTGTACPTGSPDVVNRVARFKLGTNNVVDTASEQVLIDNIPSWGGNHNGGDVHFGKDGLLYISVGDGGSDYAGGGSGGTNDAARDQFVLLGKILRIDRTGGIPAGNPWQGAGTARCNVNGRAPGTERCQETFAWGLRNPFRIAFDPNAAGTAFNINDVGQSTWEEIDRGAAGADYGWNVREGFCANGSTTNCGAPPTGMTNPILAYGRSDGCVTITGGAFVPSGVWPAPYSGSYLFADYGCGSIFRLVDNGNGTFSRADFVTGLGGSSATSLTFGPSPAGQSLYYTSYLNGGTVHRINSTAVAGRPPTAAITTAPGKVFKVGQSLTFRGKGTDPEDGTVPASRLSWTVLRHHGAAVDTYLGPVTGASVTVTGPAPEDLAAATNSYLEVRLTATDSTGLSNTAVYVLNPKKINVTLATNPAGLTVQLNGTPMTGPTTFVSWSGWSVEVYAPSPQNGLSFRRWSDSGAQRHTIAPALDKTVTAKFA